MKPREPTVAGGQPRTDNVSMQARMAAMETALEFIQRDIAELRADAKLMRQEIAAIRTTDFRLTFGTIIGVALGLAGMMAKGFGWL